MNETTFSRLFIQFRERIDLNPTDLARELGISPGYVFNIESGRSKPTREVFDAAAKRFNLTADEEKEFLRRVALPQGKRGREGTAGVGTDAPRRRNGDVRQEHHSLRLHPGTEEMSRGESIHAQQR